MERRRHNADIMFVLALAAMFFVFAFFTVTVGANVYAGIEQRSSENFSSRTGVMYISEKIRQNEGSCRLSEVEGSPALVLEHSIQGEDCETWIFVYDGKLTEATVVKGTDVTSDYGQALMDVSGVSFDYVGSGLIQITVTDSGGHSCRCTLGL